MKLSSLSRYLCVLERKRAYDVVRVFFDLVGIDDEEHPQHLLSTAWLNLCCPLVVTDECSGQGLVKR